MNETKRNRFKKRAAVLAVASCASLLPALASAAGLGKLTVLSGLGQPLRAELDIAASREELAGMAARLASPDSFKQAGIDYSSFLNDLRFSVEKRSSGQSVVKVTSSRPINEPFLDFLVELTWPAGRLVREYTFLLDPPDVTARQDGKPVVDARVVETVRGGGAQEDRRPTPKVAPKVAAVPKTPAEPTPKSDAAGGRVVNRGDTLRKIAADTKFEGVTLEQMLVGLYKANPDAFVGHNVNRLKAGAILAMPERSAVEAVTPAEARKVYVAQAADWNSYRQKLAQASVAQPAKDDAAAAQTSTGKITAKVEDKAAPAQVAKDQVKVGRTENAATSASAAAMAEQVAKDKALKEAQERMASLEKNVSELQKLLEMKNQKLAELQQGQKKEESKPAEPVKAVEPVKPVEVAVTQPKVEEAPKPVETPKVEETKPVEPAKAPEPTAAKPAEPALVKPTVAVPEPEPEAEPGFLDNLLADPLPLAGAGGLVALLAGYAVVRRRRSQNASVETTALPMPSSLGPNSVFRMTGGQSVDTGNTPPQTGDFSQTGPGTIDTDEVDPVAEADVYMAYGRDTQAEEILLEALQKDPQRTAIHAKLLEIYANRRSVKQFETLASELYGLTAGQGAEWEKVAALGLTLDPANPLYSASKSGASNSNPATAAAAAAGVVAGAVSMAEVVATPIQEMPEALEVADDPVSEGLAELSFERDTVVLPGQEKASPEEVVDAQPEPTPYSGVASEMTLDFDLGTDEVPSSDLPVATMQVEAEPLSEQASVEADALDFDLAVSEPAAFDVGGDAAATLVDSNIDLDVALDDLQAASFDEPASHDFSPDGTLVMPPNTISEDIDIGLDSWSASGEGGTTVVDGTSVQTSTGMGDFEDAAPELVRTVVNQPIGIDTVVSDDMLTAAEPVHDPKLDETLVGSAVDAEGLEFDVNLTDSVFLGQPMEAPDFDMSSINLDLSVPPKLDEAPAVAALQEEAKQPDVPAAPADAQREEVNTKLDLAKAYEEMGDLEGARELLQEVIGDAPPDLVEQAKAILDRIGE